MFTKAEHKIFSRLSLAGLNDVGTFNFFLAVSDSRRQVISEINGINPAWQEPVPHDNEWHDVFAFNGSHLLYRSWMNYWPNALKTGCLPFDFVIEHPSTTDMDADDIHTKFSDIRQCGHIKIQTDALLYVKIPPEEKELLKAIGNIHTNTYTSESISCSVPSAAVSGVPF